jgi:tryptophanyl-tRNA synthetase
MSTGVSNLFELLRACNSMDIHDSLMEDYKAGTLKYSALKEAVADALVGLINPLRARLAELNADKRQVKALIQDSSAEVRKKAQQTLREVREIAGLLPLK